MIVALVTPHYYPSVRGNSITVQRIESGLHDHGVDVRVFSLDRQDQAEILAALARVGPDLIHGFHATVTGSAVTDAAARLRIPSAITLTGTDVNHDLFDPIRRPLVHAALNATGAVVVFHETIGAKIRREIPAVAHKIRVIGQGVRCDGTPYDIRAILRAHPGDFVFFQPAGIRRVKNIPSILPVLATLHRQHPEVRYVLAGPVIEPDEAARVSDALCGHGWATFLGALDHDQICAALLGVQAVINSSLSEGGMSNAVLEAMSKGIPVLASDIEGNRSVIADGDDGFLFASPAEFLAKAVRLLEDPGLRAVMGHRARMKAATRFRLGGEIGKYLDLYRELVAGGGG